MVRRKAGLATITTMRPRRSVRLAAKERRRFAAPPVVAEVDGHRYLLEAKDEIILRCGEASITLRRDGRIVIRGVQVESHAAGLNRMKGATVKIN